VPVPCYHPNSLLDFIPASFNPYATLSYILIGTWVGSDKSFAKVYGLTVCHPKIIVSPLGYLVYASSKSILVYQGLFSPPGYLSFGLLRAVNSMHKERRLAKHGQILPTKDQLRGPNYKACPEKCPDMVTIPHYGVHHFIAPLLKAGLRAISKGPQGPLCFTQSGTGHSG